MYIHSVLLNNYKSIGEDKNVIILEPRVTTIIGRNESGKSNVLEGLSHISLLGNMQSAFHADNINRNNGTTAEIIYTIILKPSADEQMTLGLQNDTQIVIQKDGYAATGGLLTYYNEHIRESVDNLVKIIGQNPFKLRDQDFANYRSYITALQQETSLHFYRINIALNFFKANLSKLDKEVKDIVATALTETIDKWEIIKSALPTIFYRATDKALKNQYKLDEVQKELENPASSPSSLLSDFVSLIGISNADFITAVQAGLSGAKTTIRKRINKNIDEIINKKFQVFYSTESISLNAEFDSNIVSFSVQSSDGEALLLSERSNGLRWYLNTFIDAISHGLDKNNVVYLFDEPGTSLHVNAQKELISLFHNLADKGNQVVYSTHSPYMLDMIDDGIHRIRAVEKAAEGYTYIYKTAYDAQLSPDSQADTLAPIINAIGMNLYDTFGPAKDKLNIVIEGVSDYIYIQTMAKTLGYDLKQYALIPSVGATNCINICTILHGWGCPFFAVFDYDSEGVSKGGEVLRKNFLFEFNKQYCYIKSVTQEEVDEQTYRSEPCLIEDVVTEDELKRFMESKIITEGIGKPLKAKLFSNAIEDGTYTVGGQCKANFESLLRRITRADV